MTPAVSPDVVQAVDALNSWVRSESARGWHSSPRNAIYDWKVEILRRATAAGEAAHHAIYLSLTCRDCGGTKRYTDSYGYTHPHCRKCSSTGVVRLHFVVSELYEFRWHTPWERSYKLPLGLKHEDATLSADWEPNQKGRDLQVWEVAKHLNILEAEMPNVPGSHGVYDHGDYYGESDHKKYNLNVGRTDETCQLCGATEDGYGYYGVTRNCIEFTAYACKVCKALYEGSSIFAQFKVPPAMIEHPEIRKWILRHEHDGAKRRRIRGRC